MSLNYRANPTEIPQSRRYIPFADRLPDPPRMIAEHREPSTKLSRVLAMFESYAEQGLKAPLNWEIEAECGCINDFEVSGLIRELTASGKIVITGSGRCRCVTILGTGKSTAGPKRADQTAAGKERRDVLDAALYRMLCLSAARGDRCPSVHEVRDALHLARESLVAPAIARLAKAGKVIVMTGTGWRVVKIVSTGDVTAPGLSPSSQRAWRRLTGRAAV